MTMPNIVWINNGDNQQTWLHSCNSQHTQRMIRADIAEELVWALEAAKERLNGLDDELLDSGIDATLAVYREASK